MFILGIILALVVAVSLDTFNGAYLMAYGDWQAVHITSVPWEKPGVTNPYVRAMTDDVDRALNPTNTVRQVCVRSEHSERGVLSIRSDRFRPAEIPHGIFLRTRCVDVITLPWQQERLGRVFVQEGTYWGQNGSTDGPVEGWIRNITIRKEPVGDNIGDREDWERDDWERDEGY